MTSEKEKERNREYYLKHREKCIEISKKWKRDHPEQARQHVKTWQTKHREKYLIKARKNSKITNQRKRELIIEIKKLSVDELLELVGYK